MPCDARHRGAPDGDVPPATRAAGPVAPPLGASPHRVRIIDGTLACLARHGTAKTTVDDIARESGVSRATVYRAFPGGRDEILGAVVDTEMARLFSRPRRPARHRRRPGDRPGRRHRGGLHPPPGPCRPALPGRARAGPHPRPPGVRRVGPPAGHRLPVRRAVPRPLDEPGRGRAGGRVGHPDRPVLRHLAVRPRSTCATRPMPTRLVTTFMLPGIEALRSAAAVPIDITPFPGGTATGRARSRRLTTRPAATARRTRSRSPHPRAITDHSTPPTVRRGTHT